MFNDTDRLGDMRPIEVSRLFLGGSRSIDFAAYAEPADDVVTETGPDSFHRYLASSPTSKLPQSTPLLDPGVRELSDL